MHLTDPQRAIGTGLSPADQVEIAPGEARRMAWPTAGLLILVLSLMAWAVIGGAVILLAG